MQLNGCPVCQNKWSDTFQQVPTSIDGAQIECGACGRYRISGTALATHFNNSHSVVSERIRALISHRIRQQQSSTDVPLITTYWLDELLKHPNFPTPKEQANLAVKFIGDRVNETGNPIEQLASSFYAEIGAPNPRFAFTIAQQLSDRGVILGIFRDLADSTPFVLQANLSLAGWEIYENEKHGRIVSSYGFIALKFGDENLDKLLAETMKPAISSLGYVLQDLRDWARPGVIDNILRETIRDAAFIIADLSHDNLGAYWEAGYAEGLGKPVLYICHDDKFEISRTHFDTAHSTTVTWGGKVSNEVFARNLKATLRNSLALFPKRVDE